VRRLADRRIVALVLLAAAVAGLAVTHHAMPGWYARLWYPLRYEEAIRSESRRNALDPALVAAVIYEESGFVPDSRSSRGAVGLMQLLPSTAEFVADSPDRPSPAPTRLDEPEVNIAYGTRYLRYLIERLGSIDLALAAYNGGEANVARWQSEARARGTTFTVPEDIPFEETRDFVRSVLRDRAIYRRAYGDELGGEPSATADPPTALPG
jgi:soluble lytic murein transglycosylase